jgi:hypothetical protein
MILMVLILILILILILLVVYPLLRLPTLNIVVVDPLHNIVLPLLSPPCLLYPNSPLCLVAKAEGQSVAFLKV